MGSRRGWGWGGGHRRVRRIWIRVIVTYPSQWSPIRVEGHMSLAFNRVPGAGSGTNVSVRLPKIYKALKTFLTLKLSQCQKTGKASQLLPADTSIYSATH